MARAQRVQVLAAGTLIDGIDRQQYDCAAFAAGVTIGGSACAAGRVDVT